MAVIILTLIPMDVSKGSTIHHSSLALLQFLIAAIYRLTQDIKHKDIVKIKLMLSMF